MPYLTLWDKISQNLAHLEGNSHKKFRSHRIFKPIYNRFYEEININHTLLRFSQASDMKTKDFRLYWGSSEVMFKKISQNFIESHLEFCLISQILVYSLWHIWNRLYKKLSVKSLLRVNSFPTKQKRISRCVHYCDAFFRVKEALPTEPSKEESEIVMWVYNSSPHGSLCLMCI